MSSIPNKAMPHAKPEPGSFDAEEGKIAPPSAARATSPKPAPGGRGWILGAAGAGVAIAAGVAALLSLRGSAADKPVRRPTKKVGTKTPQRRQTKKKAA